MLSKWFINVLKVKLHPSCQNQSGKSEEWYVFDEMTKSGRVALLKSVTPIQPKTIAMFAGPLSLEKVKIYQDQDQECQVELTDWLCFESNSFAINTLLELRQKWFAYFVCMLKNPGKPISQVISKKFQKIPKNSKKFHKIPKNSKKFQFQKIPKNSKKFQKIP